MIALAVSRDGFWYWLVGLTYHWKVGRTYMAMSSTGHPLVRPFTLICLGPLRIMGPVQTSCPTG